MTSQNGTNRRSWLILRGIENMKGRMGFADMMNELRILKKICRFVVYPVCNRTRGSSRGPSPICTDKYPVIFWITIEKTNPKTIIDYFSKEKIDENRFEKNRR